MCGTAAPGRQLKLYFHFLINYRACAASTYRPTVNDSEGHIEAKWVSTDPQKTSQSANNNGCASSSRVSRPFCLSSPYKGPRTLSRDAVVYHLIWLRLICALPRIIEEELGSSIESRNEALQTLRELGPPDLVHIIKRSVKSTSREVFVAMQTIPNKPC